MFALTHPELAPSAEGYVPEPPGCPPETAADLPILPLPWHRRIETFIPPGSAIPTFALDYEVAPLARVERVNVSYEVDTRTELSNRESSSRCPLTLPSSDWLPAVTENIVRARVELADEGGEGRSGDLFVSVGTREVTVSLTGLDLSSSDPAEQWFALYEPAWGEPRIALLRVPDTGVESLSITGLPAGPGRLALIQTAAVVEQEGTILLHAPEGFAGDFAAYTRGWYQAMALWADEADALTLARISPPNASPRFANLGDDVAWNPADGPLIVSCPSARETGIITLPCDTAATLVVTGFGDVTVTAQGGAPVTMSPGATSTPSTTCSGEATEMTWTIETLSSNGRSFDIVLRTETP